MFFSKPLLSQIENENGLSYIRTVRVNHLQFLGYLEIRGYPEGIFADEKTGAKKAFEWWIDRTVIIDTVLRS